MNDLQVLNNDIASLVDMEYYPVEIDDSMYNKIPLTELSTLGTVFSSVAEPFRTVTTTATTDATGYWKLVSNTNLYQGKDGLFQGVERKIVSGKGNKAIAEFGKFQKGGPMTTTTTTTLPINPAMVCIAIALVGIDKKLSQVQESQEKLLDILEAQERAEIRADLLFLNEMLQDFKYNATNERFINVNYNQVLHIKRSSAAKLIEYSERINKTLSKQKLIHTDADVKKISFELTKLFNEYQLALYVNSFSSFIEVLFNQVFETTHLNDISTRIENNLHEFTLTIEESVRSLDDYYESTFGNQIINVAALAGKVVQHTPIINKSAIGELIVDGTDFAKSAFDEWKYNILKPLNEKNGDYVRPFVKGIKEIDLMNSSAIEYITDGTNLFLPK